MAQLGETQLRLVYSLLKPAVRAAARFHVPVRTLTELLRLAYFELLIQEGLTQAKIARRFGQTERHMRSLAQRLRGDFFAAEKEVGIVREIENLVATQSATDAELKRRLRSYPASHIDEAIELLLSEGRIVQSQGRLAIARKFVVLSSEKFSQRIDALNHFLDGMYRAAIARLVFDERHEAMIKTISFSAIPEQLGAFVRRLEGDLRRELAALEESAMFDAQSDRRYTLGLSLAPLLDAPAAASNS
jgi:hypothetical protein